MIDMFHYSLIWLLLGSLILAIYIIFDADISNAFISNAFFWWVLGGIPIIVNCLARILRRIITKRQEAEQKHKNKK